MKAAKIFFAILNLLVTAAIGYFGYDIHVKVKYVTQQVSEGAYLGLDSASIEDVPGAKEAKKDIILKFGNFGDSPALNIKKEIGFYTDDESKSPWGKDFYQGRSFLFPNNVAIVSKVIKKDEYTDLLNHDDGLMIYVHCDYSDKNNPNKFYGARLYFNKETKRFQVVAESFSD